jgi:hypothetical protein
VAFNFTLTFFNAPIPGQFRVEFDVRMGENQSAVILQQGVPDGLSRVWSVAFSRQASTEKCSVQFL